ncbi:MAG: aspartate 1-decarboxylase [Candidatus Omnitrophica bacterium]|nr:aspartate 1-decarboxylase [Candidatus Omnitrophota bacterium]MBU4590274.1 aspartate 1-decarboxylase [Candidatus Omnitrophota bacterium]
MFRTILKAKIHGAKVTESNVDYEGSITIDIEMLEAVDIIAHEKVQVVNMNNGARLETYVIPGAKGSGIIGMNGGAALHAKVGDKLLIISYIQIETKDALSYKPKIVFLDDKNSITRKK